MLIAIWFLVCVLFVVFLLVVCPLFDLCVVCYLLCVVCCLLFVVCRRLWCIGRSVVCCFLFFVFDCGLGVGCWLFAMCCAVFVV